MRRFGTKGHPAQKVQMSAAGLYDMPTDSEGESRVDAGGVTQSVWHNVPTIPSVPISGANIVTRTFNDDDDIDTTKKWTLKNVGDQVDPFRLTFIGESGESGVITTDTAKDELTTIQSKYPVTSINEGQEVWFDVEVRVSDTDATPAEDSGLILGLGSKPTGTNSIYDELSDFVGFKSDGNVMDLGYTSNSSENNPGAAIWQSTSKANKFHHYGFHYNGVDTVYYFIDGVMQGQATMSPNELARFKNMPLYITIGVKNTEAHSQRVDIHAVLVLQED